MESWPPTDESPSAPIGPSPIFPPSAGRPNLRSLALLAVLAGSLMGCGESSEARQVIGQLEQELHVLRLERSALSQENAVLRGQVEGRPRWHDMVSLRRVGGIEGLAAYSRVCPEGEALAGFRGRAGSVLDALYPVCRPLIDRWPDLAGFGPVETELDPVGGVGGFAFEALCPDGMTLVGLHGHAGVNVDAIAPACGSLAPEGTQRRTPNPRGSATVGESRTRVLREVGGPGGTPFERMCPAEWVAVGVSGRFETYVHSLVLLCAPLPPSADPRPGQ